MFVPTVRNCYSGDNFDCFISSEFPPKDKNTSRVFDASEKVYVYVKFHHLKPGRYLISTTWLKYTDEAERITSSQINIDSSTEYTYYSWFKLMKKGPVSQMFMGEEYDFDQKGLRKVIVQLNGEKICSKSFEYL